MSTWFFSWSCEETISSFVNYVSEQGISFAAFETDETACIIIINVIISCSVHIASFSHQTKLMVFQLSLRDGVSPQVSRNLLINLFNVVYKLSYWYIYAFFKVGEFSSFFFFW